MHRLVERGRGAGIPRSRGRFVPFDRIGCVCVCGTCAGNGDGSRRRGDDAED